MLTVMPVHTFFDKMSGFPMFGASGKTQFMHICLQASAHVRIVDLHCKVLRNRWRQGGLDYS